MGLDGLFMPREAFQSATHPSINRRKIPALPSIKLEAPRAPLTLLA